MDKQLNLETVLPPDHQSENKIVVQTNYIGRNFPDELKEFIFQCVLQKYNFGYTGQNSIFKTISERSNKNKVIFHVISEGLPYTILTAIDYVIKKLIDAGVPLSSICIHSGGTDCEFSHNSYEKICQIHGFTKVKIVFFNMYEKHARDRIRLKKELYDNNQRLPTVKNKNFLCFNRTPKVHRVVLAAMLIQKGLHQNSYLSSYINGTAQDGCYGDFRAPYHLMPILMPKLGPIASEYLQQNEHLFPLRLTLNPDHENTHDISKELYLFNETYFGISVETKYFHDNHNNKETLLADLSMDCILFSEKTWKFMVAKQPFIVVGMTNSMETLRKLGYKTFHPYINETYDSIENDEDRLVAIINEVERLCSMSKDEWIIWQEQVIPIVEFNYKKLKETL